MTKLRAIAAAVLLAASYGVATLLFAPVSDHPKHALVMSVPDAGLDAGALCAYRSGLVSPAVINLWFPDAGAASSEYAIAHICAPVYSLDAGEDAGLAVVPASYYVLPDLGETRWEVWDGGAQIEVWRQGHPTAPYPCACAKDATCLLPDAGPAPTGATLAEGQWSGAGCLPKSCTELAGVSSWPPECPQ